MRKISEKGLKAINELPLWNPAENLQTEEEREAFLQVFKEDNDTVMIDYAISVVDRSRRLWPVDTKPADEESDEEE